MYFEAKLTDLQQVHVDLDILSFSNCLDSIKKCTLKIEVFQGKALTCNRPMKTCMVLSLSHCLY